MSTVLELPPGFRFHPTDDELVKHYLLRKCASQPISVPIIAEIDLYKHAPWDLPGMALYGEKEWYFFSPRDRKYPNGSRPNRSAATGYWKATGADKIIGAPTPLAIKKALVFYSGKAPKGDKTNWIMHEYRLADADRSAARKRNTLRLDDWVLCRIYNKKGAADKRTTPASLCLTPDSTETDMKPAPMAAPPPTNFVRMQHTKNECYDTSESLPRLHTDSSCSEHVLSPSSEVQSEAKWNDEWGNGINELEFGFNYMDATTMESQFGSDQMSPLQDMFMYLQRPF